MHMEAVLLDKPIEPAFITIDEAAAYTGESRWRVNELLRAGTYLAKKSGRRTLVNFASVKERAANLPDARFAQPRKRNRLRPIQVAEA